MISPERWDGAVRHLEVMTGRLLQVPRQVVVSRLAVGANVLSAYRLVVWHEPKDICLLAAITVATFLASRSVLREAIQIHIRILGFSKTVSIAVGGAAVVLVLLVGMWTNDLGCLRLAAVVAVATLAVAGVFVIAANVLEYVSGGLGSADRIPSRLDATVPTSADAGEEAMGLLIEEYLQQEGGMR